MSITRTAAGWVRQESESAVFPGQQTLNAASTPLAVAADTREILVDDDMPGPAAAALLLPSATGSGRELLVTWFGPNDNGWGVDLTPADGETLLWGNDGPTVGPATYNIRSDGNLGQSYTLRDVGAGTWAAILPAAEAQNDADNANNEAQAAQYLALNGALNNTTLADGGAGGQISVTVTDLDYQVDGQVVTLAAAANVWDLSGVNPDNGPGEFRAVGLDLEADGTAHIDDSSGTGSDANEALGQMQPPAPGRARVGVYVGGPGCDWDAGGGLTAQGTYYVGWPNSV